MKQTFENFLTTLAAAAISDEPKSWADFNRTAWSLKKELEQMNPDQAAQAAQDMRVVVETQQYAVERMIQSVIERA